MTYPEADLLGVVHVVEPDGEALGAEPDRLHAPPLRPRGEEPQPAAVAHRRRQVLAHVHPEVLLIGRRLGTELGIKTTGMG